MRALILVLTAACVGPLRADQAETDAAALDRVRKLSPEEKVKLKERLEELKKLSPEERQRLQENLGKVKSMPPEEVKKLREKTRKLSDGERRDYDELASGFSKWQQRMGYAEGFPRMLFFSWLKNEKPNKIGEIRAMDPGIESPRKDALIGSPRVDAFINLYHEFTKSALSRMEQHVGKHKCVSPEKFAELRDSAPKDFWSKWQGLTKACQAKNGNHGPEKSKRPAPEEAKK